MVHHLLPCPQMLQCETCATQQVPGNSWVFPKRGGSTIENTHVAAGRLLLLVAFPGPIEGTRRRDVHGLFFGGVAFCNLEMRQDVGA